MLVAGNQKDFADLFHKTCKSSPDKLKEKLLSASLDDWVTFLKKMKINPTKEAAVKRSEYTDKIIGLIRDKKFGLDTYDDWKDVFDMSKKPAPTPSLMIKIKDISQKSPFKDLHIIHDSTLKSITSRMRVDGYDRRWPVIIGRGDWTNGDMILIDGYTRIKAAKSLGITDVPYAIFECNSEDEALSYAVACQSARRNYTDADVVHLVNFLWERRLRSNEGTFEEPKQAQRLAEILNVSFRKVERARGIITSKNKKLLNEVLDGKRKIYEVEKILKGKKEGTTPSTTTPTKRKGKKDEDVGQDQKVSGDVQEKHDDTIHIPEEQIGAESDEDAAKDDGIVVGAKEPEAKKPSKSAPSKSSTPSKTKVRSVWDMMMDVWNIYLDWDTIKKYTDEKCSDPNCRYETHVQVLLQDVSSCKRSLKHLVEDLEAEGRIK